MYRFFSITPLDKAESPTLLETEKKHMRVLRLCPDEKIELVDGRGTLALALNDSSFTILSKETLAPPLTKKALALALLEPAHLDLVLEKGTELGITDFYLFPTTKSSRIQITPNRQERAQKILISALKQCKRLFLPTLHYISSIEELPKVPLYLADPSGPSLLPPPGSKAILVGPESGFTPQEISLFLAKGAIKVSLHENILRAETAAIVASHWLSLQINPKSFKNREFFEADTQNLDQA